MKRIVLGILLLLFTVPLVSEAQVVVRVGPRRHYHHHYYHHRHYYHHHYYHHHYR